MKKVTYLAAIVAAVCMITSCGKKDGVFNPKEKISAIYYSETENIESLNSETEEWESHNYSSPKLIVEKWNWDGKKISSIELYEPDIDEGSSELYATVRFEYDGKRIAKVYTPFGSSADIDIEFIYVYNGKRIEKIQASYMGMTLDYLGFSYDGDKLSEIHYYAESQNKKSMNTKQKKVFDRLSNLILRSYVPGYEMSPRVKKIIDNVAVSNSPKDVLGGNSIRVMWKDNNISTMVADGETILFSYDDKKNPLQGFLPLMNMPTLDGDMSGLLVFSENNVTGVNVAGEEYKYTYTYDGEWPLTRTQTETILESEMRGSYSSVFHYEYK